MNRLRQPEPYPGDQPADGPRLVRWTRRYTDPAGQPLTGMVRLTSQQRHTSGDRVIPAASFELEVTDGEVSVQLPAGSYQLTARLRSNIGTLVDEPEETLTL